VHALAKRSKSVGGDDDLDDDINVYVEETIAFSPFVYPTNGISTSPQKQGVIVPSLPDVLLSVPSQIEHFDEDKDLQKEQERLKALMSSREEYMDEEIDKLIETLSSSGLFGKNTIVNGEIIDNDIRLSEIIKERLDDIKYVQMPHASLVEKKQFLGSLS